MRRWWCRLRRSVSRSATAVPGSHCWLAGWSWRSSSGCRRPRWWRKSSTRRVEGDVALAARARTSRSRNGAWAPSQVSKVRNSAVPPGAAPALFLGAVAVNSASKAAAGPVNAGSSPGVSARIARQSRSSVSRACWLGSTRCADGGPALPVVARRRARSRSVGPDSLCGANPSIPASVDRRRARSAAKVSCVSRPACGPNSRTTSRHPRHKPSSAWRVS